MNRDQSYIHKQLLRSLVVWNVPRSSIGLPFLKGALRRRHFLITFLSIVLHTKSFKKGVCRVYSAGSTAFLEDTSASM